MGSVVASLLFMVALNRVWPVPRRYASSDQIGWQLSVLGTTYAVLLGFMLSTQWQNFGTAELNADLEASALRNVFRLASGLPDPQRTMLESQTRDYVDAVLNDDWPAMARGNIPDKSHHFNEGMWKTLLSVRAASSWEATATDHAMSELSSMTTHRAHAITAERNSISDYMLVRALGWRCAYDLIGIDVWLDKPKSTCASGVFPDIVGDSGHARHRRH